jgi:hypothetical protein
MTRFPVQRVLGPLAALLVLGAAGGARAQDLQTAVEQSYPTNLTMLSDAANAAVTKLLMGFDAPAGATLLVEPASDHEANWFIENLLLSRLTQAGYSAYLKAAPVVGPELPRTETGSSEVAGDSTAAPSEAPSAGDLAQMAAGTRKGPAARRGRGAAEEIQTAESPIGPNDLVFRYRVAEFSILYPESHKRSPLGSRKVQRLAAVSLYANLLKGRREDVIWVGSGDTERIDVVPAGKLPLLEGKDFPFTKPTLETHGLGSLVEPALVTGIVAGLVYLFYTNQN